MLLDFVWDSLWAKGRPSFASGHVLLDNGGDWILRHYDQRKEAWNADFIRLLEFVAALPLVVTVGEGNQRYHIVHADFFSPDCPDTTLRDTDIGRLASAWRNFPVATSPPATLPDFTNRFLWSRAVMTGFTRAPRGRFLDGVSPTFCGHTIDPEIRTERSHICLDTGAFLAHYGAEAGGNTFGLSLVDVKRGTAYTLGGTRPNYRISESSVLLPG
jgi:serine/threonine protein phosphatase 1